MKRDAAVTVVTDVTSGLAGVVVVTVHIAIRAIDGCSEQRL